MVIFFRYSILRNNQTIFVGDSALTHLPEGKPSRVQNEIPEQGNLLFSDLRGDSYYYHIIIYYLPMGHLPKFKKTETIDSKLISWFIAQYCPCLSTIFYTHFITINPILVICWGARGLIPCEQCVFLSLYHSIKNCLKFMSGFPVLGLNYSPQSIFPYWGIIIPHILGSIMRNWSSTNQGFWRLR